MFNLLVDLTFIHSTQIQIWFWTAFLEARSWHTKVATPSDPWLLARLDGHSGLWTVEPGPISEGGGLPLLWLGWLGKAPLWSPACLHDCLMLQDSTLKVQSGSKVSTDADPWLWLMLFWGITEFPCFHLFFFLREEVIHALLNLLLDSSGDKITHQLNVHADRQVWVMEFLVNSWTAWT